MSGHDHPRIVCFSCGFSWGYQGDGEEPAAQLPSWLSVVCSGSIEAEQILEAFRNGAEKVLILACPEGECHFQDGNHQCRKRVELLKKLLQQHGIDPMRLRMKSGRHASADGIIAAVADMAGGTEP
jgi:coenzyme F420-reducing hydrogenase delta subunit